MKENALMEILFLTKKLEDILDKEGGVGTSFSDKVKSFDRYDENNSTVDRSDIGYKFYYSDGEYHIKEMYEDDDDIYTELAEYEAFKNANFLYRAYKRALISGYYNDLRWIGHERNQVMHVHKYKISEYRKFKNVSLEIIDYFENGKTVKKPQKPSLISLPSVVLIAVLLLGYYAYTKQEKVQEIVSSVNMATVIKNPYSVKVEELPICDYYEVISPKLSMRVGPSKSSEKVGNLSRGDIVCITKKETSWFQVEDGIWVHSNYLKVSNQ